MHPNICCSWALQLLKIRTLLCSANGPTSHQPPGRFFKKFENGYHVIRRSNQFWAGLSSDLVIEQTLMRSLKTCGGLTRGSGLFDEQRALWTMSTPISAQYKAAMQEFTNMSYCTSEQHKDLTQARMNKDLVDLEKINSKLMVCSPFSPDPSLRNIVNDVVAQEFVNNN